MEYRQIIYQPGVVARIMMNRPEYRNALSRIMLEELDHAFDRAAADEAVKVIVLSGAGKDFCAGHDLGTPPEKADRAARGNWGDMQRRSPEEQAALGLRPISYMPWYKESRGLMFDNKLRWRSLPKPTIAMVHGHCIYGGWMVATAMDLVFASPDAKFLCAHFEYMTIPWDLGIRRAKEILFENRFISAKEAREYGFVNRVVPKDRLEKVTLAYASRVAENGATGLASIKRSANMVQDLMGFQSAVEDAFHTWALNVGPRRTGASGLPKPGAPRRMTGVDVAFRHTAEAEADWGDD